MISYFGKLAKNSSSYSYFIQGILDLSKCNILFAKIILHKLKDPNLNAKNKWLFFLEIKEAIYVSYERDYDILSLLGVCSRDLSPITKIKDLKFSLKIFHEAEKKEVVKSKIELGNCLSNIVTTELLLNDRINHLKPNGINILYKKINLSLQLNPDNEFAKQSKEQIEKIIAQKKMESKKKPF
jgi:hypothetical protein